MRRRLWLTGLVLAGVLAVAVVPGMAHAATCHVVDVATDDVYDGTGAALQLAMDEATSGDRLEVSGVCRGNFKLRKHLRLVGRPTAAHPRPTLDANGHGHVLVTQVDATIRSLRIQGGGAMSGGGIVVRNGTLQLTGTTEVVGNRGGGGGGGILVGDESRSAQVRMGGHASVHGNRGRVGGGISVSFTSSVRLQDHASIWGNVADVGGGIFSGDGGVIVRGHAWIHGNRAEFGGGLYDDSGTTYLWNRARITRNVATREGGGIYQSSFPALYVCSPRVRLSPNVPDDPPQGSTC